MHARSTRPRHRDGVCDGPASAHGCRGLAAASRQPALGRGEHEPHQPAFPKGARMWLITTRGFYSAVQDLDDPNRILVRARAPKDLEALREQIPDLQTQDTSDAEHDY